MSSSNPVSIRLSDEERTKIEEIGGGSLAKGIRTLLDSYINHSPKADEDARETELKRLQEEIKSLKSSPFGFDKKEIASLEKELTKAIEGYRKSKTESLHKSLLKIIKSA